VTGAWLRRAGRIMASNQRLLFFPIALQVGGAILMLPVTLAAHDTVTFDVYARDVADDSVTLDLFGASSTSTGTYVAIALAMLAGAALTAWLSGAFIRSISDGALRWWPGARTYRLLFVIYLVTSALALGLGLLAVNDYAVPALFGGLALAVVFGFTDYAVVFEDRSIVDAIRRSLHVWRKRWREALMTWITFLVVSDIIYSLFVDKITDSDGVFPGFLGALLLVLALVSYASDCLLIALLLETPAEAPTAPGSAHPE
jgi:hypothetical protein